MRKKKQARRGTLGSFEDSLENPKSRFFGITNDVLATTTVVSVLALVLETVPALQIYTLAFTIIEYGATAIFTVEYLARIHSAKRKSKYIFSFFGIIDVLAIIPTYLGLGNFTFLKTTRALRIVRLLRMVRLAKLSKLRKKDGSSSLYALNIQIYAITLITAVLILGTLFYIFEGHQAYAQDIPTAMFWVFKAIIGGVTYPQPVTQGGVVVLILTRFCSMILLGLMLSLVGTLMRKLLIGSEKDSNS